MKTTKKGFTLIELIVVIAIIGVLAAILVPSMLGYVKKSKIQGANSTASTLAKAANSAVTDLDEEDKVPADGTVKGSDCTAAATTTEVADAIQTFFNDFKDGGDDMAVSFKDGVCIAAAVTSGAYYGTYPAVYTAKNWKTTGFDPADLDAALAAAVTKATT
ncbi:MAG: type II secretion system protein [Ruminococcus sp.]|nr:type II secretion system protein [Ruminococcus sp.]MDE6835047.1 type II secretion system GspH family protein [Ruminococcus sp.]